MKTLTPIDDALRTILSDVEAIGDEVITVDEALGRILAEPIIAVVNVPPLDNSAMDGYAVRVSDIELAKLLPVSQRIAAGEVGEPLVVNSVARIFTGAPIPVGADAVLMQESVQENVQGKAQQLVSFSQCPKVGENIRLAGQDIQLNDLLLSAGRKLTAADLGLLASNGCTKVRVAKRVKVALLSTGDELVEPGEALALGQIYNSNRPMLRALIKGLGCDVIDLGIVSDTAEATASALQQAADNADLVISTGGVSVGEEDHVKAQVERLGKLNLWKLAIKPGKPVALGRVGKMPFLGLPGNPSSSFVTFLLVARPYLLSMQGAEQVAPPIWHLPAGFDWPKGGSRQEYLRVRVCHGLADGGGTELQLFNNQSSGVLKSASWANALAIIPIGGTVKKGNLVQTMLFVDLGLE